MPPDLEVGGGGRGDIHKITAASVIFGTANTNDMVINADLVLGY